MSTKPFDIPKQLVWKAWQQVRANRGSGGVDGESIAEFERHLEDNLYRIWNLMSSGSYFPPDVRGVEIPKAKGGKSAFDAVSITRSRCWEWKWCLEFDIRAMFDRIPHDLVMKAVKKHVPEKWCELLISRWLKAGIRLPNGERKERNTGTPQGGVISPLLCNLFMHYAFDLWMKRSFPELHEDKTHVIYTGKNPALRNAYATSFDFLGFTFRIRGTKSRLQKVVTDCFLPAVSDLALKKMKHVIKRVWRFRNRTDLSLEQIAEIMNPSVRGWFNYYGKFYKSRLQIIARYINTHLVKWARSHFRRQHSDRQKMFDWLRNEYCRRPRLLSHWKYFKVY